MAVRVRVVWVLWGLVMGFFVASLVLRLWNGSALTSSLEGLAYFEEIIWWDVLIPAAIPAYATIGAVIASLRFGNRVGWLCLAFGGLLRETMQPEHASFWLVPARSKEDDG